MFHVTLLIIQILLISTVHVAKDHKTAQIVRNQDSISLINSVQAKPHEKMDTEQIPSLILTSTPIPTQKPTLILNPTDIPIETQQPTVTPTLNPEPSKLITPTQTSIPTNSLLSSVNSYRSEHGKGALSSQGTLCRIAKERLLQLIQRGSLDNHEGFQGYTSQLSSEFSSWREVIFQSTTQLSTEKIVKEGWASSPSHNESILSSESNYGCGQTEQGFAVFLLSSSR